jgi:hypothetical protein
MIDVLEMLSPPAALEVPEASVEDAMCNGGTSAPAPARNDPIELRGFAHGLIALNLSGCRLDAQSLKCASTLLAAIKLQTIVLDGCGIDDNCAAVLASNLSSYSSLRTLNLRHNAITDSGAKLLLVAAQSHPKLHTIVCDGCRVSVRLQRMLWDISKKNSAAKIAHVRLASQQVPVPASASKPSARSRVSKRAQHGCEAISVDHSRMEAALKPSQKVSTFAHDPLPRHASSFVSFIACNSRPIINSITASASVPASPVVFAATPQRTFTSQRMFTPVGPRRSLARQFGLLSNSAPSTSTRPSRSHSNDDSEFINHFIKCRQHMNRLDSANSSLPQPSPSFDHKSDCGWSATRGFVIDDLLDTCATLQDRAGIPVPLHFNRGTPLHEVRAFMRREHFKRDKTSPARLLRSLGNPAEALATQPLPFPGSPFVSKEFEDHQPKSRKAKEYSEAFRTATLHPKRQGQIDDQEWSRICALGVSSNLAPDVASALNSIVPFSDFGVEEGSASNTDDDVDASSCNQARFDACDYCSSSFVRRIDSAPSFSSLPLSLSAPQTFSSQQAAVDLSAHSLSRRAAAAEFSSPERIEAQLLHQKEGEVTIELECIIDESSLWAKNAAIMIRKALQGTPIASTEQILHHENDVGIGGGDGVDSTATVASPFDDAPLLTATENQY